MNPDCIRLLLIEDDPVWSDLLKRVFGARPQLFQVHQAFSLGDGLDLLRERGSDLVFLDLTLPDSEGLDGLHWIRSEAPHSAVVIMTGRVDESLATQALREGAQDYLVKGKLEVDALIRAARYAVERKQNEDALRQSERFMAATLDAVPACIAVLDESGEILNLNARWKRYANPHNRLIWDCPPGSNYLARCDELRAPGQDFHDVAVGIISVMSGLQSQFEHEYVSPGLQGVEPEWQRLVITRFSRDSFSRMVVFHEDITVQKQGEAQLRASEELFKVITDNVVDLLAIIDAQGRRLYTSPSYETVLGYSEEAMLQTSTTGLLHPEDVPRVEAALEKLFETGSTHDLQYRLRHADGSWLDFESNGALIRNAPGAVRQALIVARNVSERKKAENEHRLMEMQLRQAQKLEAIGQLAAGIAHEINTPTQYIGDNLLFLRDAFRDLLAHLRLEESTLAHPLENSLNQDAVKALQQSLRSLDLDYLEEEIPMAVSQALEGVGRVGRIVGAMKDFSHPGTESKTPVDLNHAIESTLTVSRNEYKYVADLETQLQPDLPLVPCFPGEFNQVILNLVVNAAHAVEESLGGRDSGHLGRILVSTHQSGDWAVVEVTDSGTGIPEAIRHRIFDPFFTTKPVGKGTGQGLAIVHHVVTEKHGGKLEVETEAGQGTTFRIWLPLALPEA